MWMQTYSGKKFSLMDPQPEDVSLTDVVMALSNMCRFTGHCYPFYSVAQHSLLVALYSTNRYTALLHDAGETYYGDISTPLKQVIEQLAGDAWLALVARIDRMVAEVLHFTYPLPLDVVMADKLLLATEKRDLMVPVDWEINLPKPANFRIVPKTSTEIYPVFLKVLHENIHYS